MPEITTPVHEQHRNGARVFLSLIRSMLTGPELLAKIKELGFVSKSELVRECGYISTKKDGGSRLNFTAFYEALLAAKGVTPDTDGGGGDTDRSTPVSYKPSAGTEIMDADKLIDSVKFLLKSVRQLSDRFVETNENIARSFDKVSTGIGDLGDRIGQIEAELQSLRDLELISVDSNRRLTELPVSPDHQGLVIPALNLPIEAILDVYRNTPVLLQPFARACSVSGRTLSGIIAEVELEVFAQGTTWIIETQDGDWMLFPRPGMLQRQTQIESLRRFFDVRVESALPAELDLLIHATATAVQHGRRWYLKEKGEIGVYSDPLQRSLEIRIRLLEQRLSERS